MLFSAVAGGGDLSDTRLLINEVSTGTPDQAELYNASSSTVDLKGWSLKTTGCSTDVHPLPSFPLAPGAHLSLTEHSGAPADHVVYTDSDICWSSGGSGSAALIDPQGRAVDFVRWGGSQTEPPGGTGWTEPAPLPGPGLDEALGRDCLGSDTDSSADWSLQSQSAPRRNPGCTLYSLVVTRAGAGTVASPDLLISCGSDCFQLGWPGESFKLTALPASGWSFAGWEGACSGTGICSIVLNADTRVTATFEHSGAEPQYWHQWFAVHPRETPAVGDFNGDGKADIITFTRDNPSAVGDVYVALSDGTEFGNGVKWHDWFAIDPGEEVVIGDFDGDGDDDIATWLGPNRALGATFEVYVALSTGTGMTPAAKWLNMLVGDSEDVLLTGNPNGDWHTDLILFARSRGKVYVALSDGTSFLAPREWHGWFAVSTHERPRVADVNGDGTDDIITFATDSPTAFGDVYVALSDGSRFVDQHGTPNSSSKWHDWFAIDPTQDVKVGDLDGDSRQDAFTFLPSPWGQVYSVLSRGDSLGPNQLLVDWAEIPGASDRFFVGDVDGDGRVDFIQFARADGKVKVLRMTSDIVPVFLDLRATGVVVRWSWPAGGGTTATVIRIDGSGAETILLQTADSQVSEYLDEGVSGGNFLYVVEFDAAAVRVAGGSAEIIVPPRWVSAGEPTVVSTSSLFPAVADVNGDGLIDLLGSLNLGMGVMQPQALEAIGLQALFEGGRWARDQRLADLDGDGDWDLVGNSYSGIEDENTNALLFWNDGAGTFALDPQFSAMQIRGFGETILAFDYDNDSDLDLFLPYYSFNDPAEHSYLLENDGAGRFMDVSDLAGVALRNRPFELRVEGAHAADVNDDGYIDFFVGSHLFLNRGDGTFYDSREASGLPERFDEGLSFIDWNADGALDFVTLDPWLGPSLFEQVGTSRVSGESLVVPVFQWVDVIPQLEWELHFGLKVTEVNNDGLADILVASGPAGSSILLLNRRERFERNLPPLLEGILYDLIACGDFDDDNRMDLVFHAHPDLLLLLNTTGPDDPAVFWVRVLGDAGRFNQQGRVVRAWPHANPDFVITRIVEGGSGYLSQSQYELHFGTPYAGPHQVEVRFAEGRVSFTISPGERVEVTPDGTIAPY